MTTTEENHATGARPMTSAEMREALISHLRAVAHYWSKAPVEVSEGVSEARQRCDGVVFSVLCLLDGVSGGMPGFDLVPVQHPSHREEAIAEGEPYWPNAQELEAQREGIGDVMLHEMYYHRGGSARPPVTVVVEVEVPDPKPTVEVRISALSFADLRVANKARQAEWCAGGDAAPDLAFRGNELAGEVGETVEAMMLHGAELAKAAGRASNVVKKLERERHGWRGSRATEADLASELADVLICADLLAMTAGIDLAEALPLTFNATSERVGLATRLGEGALPPVAEKSSWVDRAAWCAKGLLGVLPEGYGEQRDPRGKTAGHMRWLCRQLVACAVDSDTKACRWLAYAQAGAILYGYSTLEAEKARNLASGKLSAEELRAVSEA